MYSKFIASIYKAKPDRTNRRKQNLIELIEERHVSTIMIGNFNTPHLDRTSR